MSCADLENPVDWKEKRAEDYARPSEVSDLRRFVLDIPLLIDKCNESVWVFTTYMLERNRELFEAALAVETDPEFEPYIATYIEEKGEPLLYDVRIVFSQRPMLEYRAKRGEWPIACDSITKNIYVDRDYWESLEKEAFKRSLVHHELGHCDLNREHVGHFSLMNDGVLTGIEYNTELESQDFYDALYVELFSTFSERKETHHRLYRREYINTIMDMSILLHRTGLGMDEPGLIRAGLKDRNR